jgi:uncharacterized protein (TIGR03067 family)
MKNLFYLITAVAVVFAANAAEKATPKKPAAAPPLEGVWKPIAAVLNGARLPAPVLQAITLKIAGANYEVSAEGEKQPDQGTCVLDTSTSPNRMIITSTNGPNRGKTFLAIYEMKDARSLRVCYDLTGTEFPKKFKAPKGTSLYLVGYRRQNESRREP